MATQVGLRTPETLITNDPAEAAAFLDRIGPGQAVRKAFRNIGEAPRVTALVGDADRAKLKLVRHAPVILQRFVPAVADLRVTLVEDEVFAALITSDEGSSGRLPAGPEHREGRRPPASSRGEFRPGRTHAQAEPQLRRDRSEADPGR